jgi:site-specific DNA-methyltransferase (adenine-specific)
MNKKTDDINLIHGDNLEYLKTLDDNSVDAVITDPPYLYLKNQKLERPFDEKEFFGEVHRVLKDNSFLVFFGRGISMSRWNLICDELGFNFKEEIVWKKNQLTNFLNPLPRKHELISVFAKGKVKLNTTRINYFDEKIADDCDIKNIQNSVSRCLSGLKSIKDWEDFLQFQKGDFIMDSKQVHNLVGNRKRKDPAVVIKEFFENGIKLNSIINTPINKFNRLHPTQKPVELMKRLIELTTNENDLILDPFMGSGTTGVASLELNRKFIGVEIDEEYFNIAKNRIEQKEKELSSNLFREN